MAQSASFLALYTVFQLSRYRHLPSPQYRIEDDRKDGPRLPAFTLNYRNTSVLLLTLPSNLARQRVLRHYWQRPENCPLDVPPLLHHPDYFFALLLSMLL